MGLCPRQDDQRAHRSPPSALGISVYGQRLFRSCVYCRRCALRVTSCAALIDQQHCQYDKHSATFSLPELLLHPHTGPGSSSVTVDPGSESTSEMMCGGGRGGGSGGMTSSFTWLESVNSTMDEIKTLIVNQEVRHVILSPRSHRRLHIHFLQPTYFFPACVGTLSTCASPPTPKTINMRLTRRAQVLIWMPSPTYN